MIRIQLIDPLFLNELIFNMYMHKTNRYLAKNLVNKYYVWLLVIYVCVVFAHSQTYRKR